MVDGLTPQDPIGTPTDPVGSDSETLLPDEVEKKRGFFSSPTGKIVGIIAAALIVLGILGVLAVSVYSFMFVNDAQKAIQAGMESAVSTGAATASGEATEAVPVEPDAVALNTIFTFRDIFDPLVKQPPESTETSGSTENTSTEGKLSADVSEGTLYLQSIVTEDGVPKAVLLWNGDEYRLAEGESIPGTPWEVRTINDSSVVMLYGDQQVTLSVGQGTSK